MPRLEDDTRLQKSVERLRAMGLKFLLQTPTPDECYLIIDMESMMNLVAAKLTYPTKTVSLEREGKKTYVFIHFWKGEKPLVK